MGRKKDPEIGIRFRDFEGGKDWVYLEAEERTPVREMEDAGEGSAGRSIVWA